MDGGGLNDDVALIDASLHADVRVLEVLPVWRHGGN